MHNSWACIYHTCQIYFRKTSILQKPEFAFLREIAQTIQDVNSTQEEASDADPEAGPVDFSIRSHNVTEPPARISATARPAPSSTSGVLNLSNAGGAGSPPITGPRPRGRPRKQRPGDVTLSPAIPSTSSYPLPPKKNAAGRVSYNFNNSPKMTMPSATPLISSSFSLGGSGSSFEALSSVISMPGGGSSSLPQVQSPSIHQYPQTVAAASHRNVSATATSKRKSFNSDQDSDYDNDGYGEDGETTEEDDDNEEQEESVPLRKSAKISSTSQELCQRASVLVANPRVPLPPITSTVTSNDEDDDYDNC